MAEIAGLKLIVPSSVAGSGVSVSASGKVTFTAATSVSVNGVFDSTYDNYLVVMRMACSGNDTFYYRLRASGSDNTTASSYTSQQLYAGGTTVGGGRQSQSYGLLTYISSAQRNGAHVYLYGPALAQPTAIRSVSVSGYTNAYIDDDASTHNQSTAYDGITVYPGSTNITGALTIYGLSQ